MYLLKQQIRCWCSLFAILRFYIRGQLDLDNRDQNVAHLQKKRFLLTLHYPIRNWFSEIRKINSVITALKFQRQKFTCTGRNCIYVIMKGCSFC